MKCPSCESVLGPIKYENVEIEICPDCRGVWLDGSRLRSIERRREIIVDERAVGRATSKPVSREVRRVCPGCAQPMKKYRYGKDKRIIVDQCPACQGIWLDDGELEAIQHAYERWEEFLHAERGSGDRRPAQPRIPSKEMAAARFARNMNRTSLTRLFVKWILSLFILLAPAVLIQYATAGETGLGTWGVYFCVWAVLLLIGRYVEFYPDTDDLGWFGGWMDDPFSWSDNHNRFLFSCKIVFMLPKFVANTFADTLETCRAHAELAKQTSRQ